MCIRDRLNTGNNMMIADIAEGGSHEVDGICYIGCPNDYQTCLLYTSAMRGLAALMTCLMVLSIVGTGVANTYRGALDDTLGTESLSLIHISSLIFS